mmetsp:Transcript_7445/g.26537  ORF Transcript_7445/g.26537 Transcript_7445/m.26537 type:complete len:191 (+) Transcript_7445:92-664(+)
MDGRGFALRGMRNLQGGEGRKDGPQGCTYSTSESITCRSVPDEDGRLKQKCERVRRKFRQCPGRPREEVEVVTEETTDEGGANMQLPFGGWGNALGGAEELQPGERPEVPFGGPSEDPLEGIFRRMLEMQRSLGLPIPEELFRTYEDKQEGHSSGFLNRMFGGGSQERHDRSPKNKEPKFGEYEKDFQEV